MLLSSPIESGEANLKVHDVQPGEVESVRLFLCAQGWAHRVGDAAKFDQLIARSQRTAVAVSGAGVVGFARGITDGLSNGYLSMVAVAQGHRLQGLGRALVEHIIGDDADITWVLRAGREGAVKFFRKLGFSASAVAMERRRS
jgi:ribosomal protein S18 acetylase RimI-like enzyme